MKEHGVYSAVEPIDICDKYLSCTGKDINGNQIDPDELSKIFLIEWRDGEVYIPRRIPPYPKGEGQNG